MRRTRIEVARIPTENENEFIVVDVYYTKGGMSMFTYKQEPRGYWMSAQPTKFSESETGLSCRSFMAFSGRKAFIEAANRFSRKRLETVAATATELAEYGKLIEAVKEPASTREMENE